MVTLRALLINRVTFPFVWSNLRLGFQPLGSRQSNLVMFIKPLKTVLLETCIREASPKESPYNPWGRPGAGAPLKDERGNVMTNTTGKLANYNMVSTSICLFNNKMQYYISISVKHFDKLVSIKIK